jgi:hypothetical protein
MPTVMRRFAGGAAAAVALALAAAACGGGTAQPATVAASQSPATTSPTPTPTPTPTRTGPGPMTAAELYWLSSVEKMHYQVDKLFHKDNVVVTRNVALSWSNALGQCSRTLHRIGPGTARLRPVYTLVKKACALFDKGAKCWATAAHAMDAGGGVVSGTPEERIVNSSMSCGDASYGDGTNLLGDAELKGGQIKSEAD